jgi:hypothetical protein
VNEQIKQHLDAEAASDSRGYFTDRPIKQLLLVGPADGAPSNGPAIDLARLSKTDVAVLPLANVSELLDLARAQER